MPPLDAGITCYEIPPIGMAFPKRPAAVLDVSREHAVPLAVWKRLAVESLLSRKLDWLATRQQHLNFVGVYAEEEERSYSLPLVEVFRRAAFEVQSISINSEVMAGAPCIDGTRIPVYMILDAVEHTGNLEGALESYPRLTLQQVKDAIGFAKLVVECPIEHEDTITAR